VNRCYAAAFVDRSRWGRWLGLIPVNSVGEKTLELNIIVPHEGNWDTSQDAVLSSKLEARPYLTLGLGSWENVFQLTVIPVAYANRICIGYVLLASARAAGSAAKASML